MAFHDLQIVTIITAFLGVVGVLISFCENTKVSEEIVKCVHNFNTGAANAKSNVRHSLSLSPLPAAWHDTRFTRREA